jgi:Tir chaperone protein (CesT) family
MTLNEILVEMRVLTGISDLSLDPDTRACRLIFGGQDEVEFEEVGAEEGGIFFIHAVVGAIPRSSPSHVFSEVLKAGLFGFETGSSSFGYDDVREELVLFQRIDPRHQNMEGFARELEGFLEVLKRQKRKLTDGHTRATQAEEINPLNYLNSVRG